jgi:hypothetical protein
MTNYEWKHTMMIFIRHSSFVIPLFCSGSSGQYLLNPPSLACAQRTRFDDAHSISDLAGSIFIVRQEFGGFPLNLFVKGVLYKSIDSDGNCLLHGRAGYRADLAFADSPFLFSTHYFPTDSRFEIRDSRLKIRESHDPEYRISNFESLLRFHFLQYSLYASDVSANTPHFGSAFQLTRGGLETESEKLLAQFGLFQYQVFL